MDSFLLGILTIFALCVFLNWADAKVLIQVMWLHLHLVSKQIVNCLLDGSPWIFHYILVQADDPGYTP